jgi:AbrB family looped-hinge helix DNA binding protein
MYLLPPVTRLQLWASSCASSIDDWPGKTYLTGLNAQTRLSAKGQVVIPKDVRDRLGLAEGTVFDVIERAGEVVLRQHNDETVLSGPEAVENAVQEIRSFYRYEGAPVSIEDMDQAVSRAVREKFRRKLKA